MPNEVIYSSLMHKQREIYEHMKALAEREIDFTFGRGEKLEQSIIFLSGEGGTGKSLVRKLIWSIMLHSPSVVQVFSSFKSLMKEFKKLQKHQCH